MIYGIGIDIVKIERMKSVVEKWGGRFLKKVFTKVEINYCYEKKNPHLSFAVRFAAKEAFIKAIGAEIAIPLTDVEIINAENGKPCINMNGKLGGFLKNKGINGVLLSLSHEKEYGVACVVLDK
ncbi:MAG: holo-ACP synthase [Nitrospiraceae bacterium]|nr:holo-ACP synthase [Nitrospiraceae bacterium]